MTRAECAPPARRPPDPDRDLASARRSAGRRRFGLASGLAFARSIVATQLAGLRANVEIMVDIASALAIERGDGPSADMLLWAQAVSSSIEAHRHDLAQAAEAAGAQRERLAVLESTARSMALAMEFGFLLDPERQLLSIGYLVNEGALDQNCYDLLASEARLASFFAIAKGDVAAKHWFRLGRAATPVAHGAALISWSGSMFEYLMPSLVMRAPAGSLLEQTNRLIVRPADRLRHETRAALGHIRIRLQRPRSGVDLSIFQFRRSWPRAEARPWRKQGHRALRDRAGFDGRSAGGGAPISSAWPRSGAKAAMGSTRRLDYTPARVPEGESVAIVRAFMAHHQGMTIVAIADALLDGAMRARFHAEPIIKATELLLQERMPRDVAATRLWAADVKSAAGARNVEPLRRSAVRLGATGDARHASAFERPLCDDAHRRRLGIQPLGRSGADALARGRDLRRLRLLHLCQGFAQRRRRGRRDFSRPASSRTPITSPSMRTAPSSRAATAR